MDKTITRFEQCMIDNHAVGDGWRPDMDTVSDQSDEVQEVYYTDDEIYEQLYGTEQP